jgi:hypothetical protein
VRRHPLTYLNILLLGVAFVIMVLIKPNSLTYFSQTYLIGFAILAGIWSVFSFTFRKYNPKNPPSNSVSLHIVFINIIILGIIAISMYGARSVGYSRLIVFGTIGIATLFELTFNGIYQLVKQNGDEHDSDTLVAESQVDYIPPQPVTAERQAVLEKKIREISPSAIQLKKDIIEECSEKGFHFIENNIDLADPRNLVISTTTVFNILYQPDDYFRGIINLKRINDIRYINKFFEGINRKLPVGGVFISCAETKNQRKERILRKYPPVLNWIYYFFDYILKRIFPKFQLTKNIYFFLTRGQNRVFTRAEILGRLYSSGFEIEKEEYVNGRYFFVVHKVKQPSYDPNPTYGLIVRLPRIGKDGKIIKVYKMRTMHAYAEYLQEYVYNMHHLREGGKFNNDFRISMAGRIMRALWIDELPMLLNWMRGELKFVGVRPISEHYFKLYSKAHQERRIKYKPGLVPPFYADLPKSLDEIEASEKRYLDAYDKHPFRTNWRYFWRAFFNIVFKRARSK